MFIAEHSFEDQKLFAKRMAMLSKATSGRVAHDRGCSGNFAAAAFKQPPLDARLRERSQGRSFDCTQTDIRRSELTNMGST